MQRFISEDQIRLLGGINYFSYVKNNPINFIDPFGHLHGLLTPDEPFGIYPPGGGFSPEPYEPPENPNNPETYESLKNIYENTVEYTHEFLKKEEKKPVDKKDACFPNYHQN